MHTSSIPFYLLLAVTVLLDGCMLRTVRYHLGPADMPAGQAASPVATTTTTAPPNTIPNYTLHVCDDRGYDHTIRLWRCANGSWRAWREERANEGEPIRLIPIRVRGGAHMKETLAALAACTAKEQRRRLCGKTEPIGNTYKFTSISFDNLKSCFPGLVMMLRANKPYAYVRNRGLSFFRVSRIDNDDFVSLAEALAQNTTLSWLRFDVNTLEVRVLKALGASLRTNTGLQQLSLKDCDLTSDHVKCLEGALGRLSEMELDDNRIGPEGAAALAQSLGANTHLRKLRLSNNLIRKQGAHALAKALETNRTLQSLDLWENHIRSLEGWGEMLRANKTLQYLNLGSNSVGAQGAQVLAEALADNKGLTDLDISFAEIGDEGVQHLGRSLERNATLTSLDLRGNRISDVGVGYLIDALARNTTLREVALDDNKRISPGCLQRINGLLQRNQLRNRNRAALAPVVHANGGDRQKEVSTVSSTLEALKGACVRTAQSAYKTLRGLMNPSREQLSERALAAFDTHSRGLFAKMGLSAREEAHCKLLVRDVLVDRVLSDEAFREAFLSEDAQQKKRMRRHFFQAIRKVVSAGIVGRDIQEVGRDITEWLI